MATRKTTKKAKKPGIKKLKKKLWKIVSEYIRLRDALETTGTREYLRCCTCGKVYPAFGKGCAQAGHFVPGRSNAVLFDERCIHGQCYNCNINLKGAHIPYRKFMIKKYGLAITEEIEDNYYKTVKYTTSDLEDMIEEYKMKLKELKGE